MNVMMGTLLLEALELAKHQEIGVGTMQHVNQVRKFG